jgi:DNA-binding response OmpR family regulator
VGPVINVLLVEDDDGVRHALQSALRRQGMHVIPLGGSEGLWGHLSAADVVLLDLGLPDADGFDICRRIREAAKVPIIIVTARSDVADRMIGLYSGADDYLVKPFNVRELIARIHAVRRRAHPTEGHSPDVVRLREDIIVDNAHRKVVVADEDVPLTAKEFEVLALLVRADGAVCSRRHILLAVWGQDEGRSGHSLDVHVATLRLKLGRPELIRTVRGVGYRLALD